MPLSESDWIAVEREFCARKLVNFVRRAWPVVEPGTAYVHGWHIDAIAEHLEAVSAGEINRLLDQRAARHDEVARRRRALAGLGVGTARHSRSCATSAPRTPRTWRCATTCGCGGW